MAKGIIKLCYRKIVDVTSTGMWEKYIFENTYKEFYMQAQQYDQARKHLYFSEILENIPKAHQIHYLVSTSIAGYIKQLHNIIPDISNTFGKTCLPFKNFRFEVIQSHIQQKELHQVAIEFYSERLIWIESIDNQLLIAVYDQLEAYYQKTETRTELVTLSPQLSINSFQKF